MNVHWTNTATDHLTAIYDYIALDAEEYAKRMVDRLTKRSEQIGNSPYSGRMVPEFEDKRIREEKDHIALSTTLSPSKSMFWLLSTALAS